MHLTIAYQTTRLDNRIEWFLDSLLDQLSCDDNITLVIVDFYHNQRGSDFIAKIMDHPISHLVDVIRTAPKPSIWQGEHRLTKENWFAASNARNTSLCMAKDGWLAYVDDLSILGPHWLRSVRESMAGNYIALGSYEKHKNMIVENGKLIYSQPYSRDARLNHVTADVTSVGGDYLYGCSLAGPVQAFLDVNGFPEMCDSLGSEDYCMGIAIGNLNRYSFRYDRRMATIESEELHHVGETFKKSDYGVSPNDCSHAALNIAKQSKWWPHYLGDGFENISQLRQHILGGGEFPVRKHPEHHWWTGIALKDL